MTYRDETDTRATYRRRGGALRTGAAVGLLSLAAPLGTSHAAEAWSPREIVDGYLGVVTTESPIASEAGLQMLRSGGNAVDAIVAAAFTRGVANFESCGIGGGGFLVYRGADGTVDTLDFYERAPGKGASYTYRSGYMPGTPTYLYDKGRGPAAIPGFVRGMEAALEKYGTKSMAEVVAPAERVARQGFPLSPQSNYWLFEDNWKYAHFSRATNDTYDIYYDQVDPLGGLRQPKPVGTRVVNLDYADTLARIAANGADEFYDVRGGYRTAKALLAAMHADPDDPSDWTAADLETYEAYWRAPVTAHYRDHHVLGVGGNSAGGTLIAETLNILEGFDLAALPQAERLHVLVEAQRIAWTDRRAYYGDPGPPGQPSTPGDQWADIPPQLTSERYAASRRAEIATGPDGRRRTAYRPGRFDGYTAWEDGAAADQGTAGLAAIDAAGNAVAMSCSIGSGMGNGLTPDGLGFLLNNSTGWDAPGSPNAPAAGKASRSSQSPTIVVRRGRPVLVVGGQGGTTIPMGVLSSVLQTVDFGALLDQALDAARVDCCGWSEGGDPNEAVYAERRAENSAALDALGTAHGHTVVSEPNYRRSPVLSAAAVDRATGLRLSSSDPRGECGPSSVDDGVTTSACYQAARAKWLHWKP